MLKSNHSVIDQCLIIDINIDDFTLKNFTYEFSTLVASSNKTKVILNLDAIEVLTSSDIEDIEKIVAILKLNGIETIVCGVNPYSASMIFTFVSNVRFTTALNIKGALDAFSAR